MTHAYNLRSTKRENQESKALKRMAPNDKAHTSNSSRDARSMPSISDALQMVLISRAGTDSTDNAFRNLPLEVRVNIYDHVPYIGESDKATKSRVYVIKERRSWLGRTTKPRRNYFAVNNLTRQSLALGQSYRQVHDEVRDKVIHPSFCFQSVR